MTDALGLAAVVAAIGMLYLLYALGRIDGRSAKAVRGVTLAMSDDGFLTVRVHVATGEEPTYTVSQAEAGRLLLKYVTRHPSTRHGDAAASDADELGGA